MGPLTKRILVLGMNPFDSGKTILSQRIVESFLESEQSIEYFKPVSGHNYWYRYEHTKRCVSESTLASRDAHQVRQLIQSKVPIEIANPVHSLFVPSILQQPLESMVSTLALAGWDSVLTMQRFTTPSDHGVHSIILLAKNLVDSESLMITPEEVNGLTSNAEVIPMNTCTEFSVYSNTHLESVLSKSLESIESRSEITIIEGFNDSAWPWEGLDRVDTILVTGPGHLFRYDPERFRKAVFLVKYNSQPIREVTFSRVSEMIRPNEVIHLRPQQGISTDQLYELGLMGKE